MLQHATAPTLPRAPDEYDVAYMNSLLKKLNDFFQQVNAVQLLSVAGLNANINTLPTQAVLATLRSGDIYRDTTAGNVLKVKP